MSRKVIDFETRSRVDLKKVGAWAYAMHPSTEILCIGVFDGECEVKLTAADIMLGRRLPPPDVYVAHNAHFEYAVYHHILVKRFGWAPMVEFSKWDCTLARAARRGLPLSLEQCAKALDLPFKKDMAGRAAMLKLCKPQADGTFCEDRETLDILYEYCLQDTRVEWELDKILPPLPPGEREVWEMDFEINKRGVLMDTELAGTAGLVASGVVEDLNAELFKLSGGAVSSASRVSEMKRWLKHRGIEVESLDKAAVTALLASDAIPKDVREVLSIRRQVGKSSVAKFTAVVNSAGPDNRARGLLQYHGAATGRWAGRLVQPQNFPGGFKADLQADIIDDLLDRPEVFPLEYGNETMDVLSGILRGVIVAPDDHMLVVADYASIEPRVLFWQAEEKAALQAYRTGSDIYVDLAKVIYDRPSITKHDTVERKLGKMGILGCGYGMGHKKFRAQCATMGLDIGETLATKAVRAYRETYPGVVKFWKNCESAARNAVKFPDRVFTVAACRSLIAYKFDTSINTLFCMLPSGRVISYFKPFLVNGDYNEDIRYMAPGLNGELEVQKTYGGSLVENIVQATARDIMVHGMKKARALGFKIVLTVHDEVVAEVIKDYPGDAVRIFESALCSLPEWAADCPISAEGWSGHRYHK